MAIGDNLGGGKSVHANLSVRGSTADVTSGFSCDDSSTHFIHNIRTRPVIGAVRNSSLSVSISFSSHCLSFRSKLSAVWKQARNKAGLSYPSDMILSTTGCEIPHAKAKSDRSFRIGSSSAVRSAMFAELKGAEASVSHLFMG